MSQNLSLELDFSSIDEKYDSLYSLFEQTILLTLKRLNRTGLYFISLALIDDETMHTLNKQYRDIDRTTDVLSFAFCDGTDLLDSEQEFYTMGDIYISINECASQGPKYNLTTDEEMLYLLIHGVLHLFGYDHVHNEEEKEVMFSLQDEIFEKLRKDYLYGNQENL